MVGVNLANMIACH